MSDQPAERELWVDALYAVLHLVAGADGRVDARELRRFEQMLDAAIQGGGPLPREVLAAAKAALPERSSQPSAADPERTLAQASTRADAALSPADAERFKRGLYAMGSELARASGAGLLGMGKRTSEEEEKALARLSLALGLVI